MTTSFSPRQRPQTVNLNGFEDSDLTDQFKDDDTTTQASTFSRRHPRGDTPLRGTGGAGTTGTSLSSIERGGQRLRGLTNLDRLLDFLDDDDDDDKISKTPDRSRMERGGGGQSSNRSRVVERLNSSTTTTTTTTKQENGSSPYSPSPRPGSVAAMRSHSKSLSFQSQNQSRESPPTIVQNLYNDIQQQHQQQHQEEEGQSREREGSVDSITRVAQAALDEFDSIISGTGTATPTTITTTTRSNQEEEENQDSESTRSPTYFHSSSLKAPPLPPPPVDSRSSRRIPSSSSSNQGNTSSSYLPPPQSLPKPIPISTTTTSTSTSNHPEKEIESDFLLQPEEEDPHQLNLQLIQELRESQDYILFLQNELKTIGNVVSKLREHQDVVKLLHNERGIEEEEEEEIRRKRREEIDHDHDHNNKKLNGIDDDDDDGMREEVKDVLRDENKKAFEIVQHLIAMIPSSTTTTSRTERTDRGVGGGGRAGGVSIESITSSLNFVRKFDTLVNFSTSPSPSQQHGFGDLSGHSHRDEDGICITEKKTRRDEEIFDKKNLERLEKIVKERFFR